MVERIVPGQAGPYVYNPADPHAVLVKKPEVLPKLQQLADQKLAALAVGNVPPIIDNERVDVIFIGSGAAGAPAAAMVAEAEALRRQGLKVLILEAGKNNRTEISTMPVAHGLASQDPKMIPDPNRTGTGTGYWVRHYPGADAYNDEKANAEGLIWKPRGAGPAGSTDVNAMVFIRPDDSDWEKIALDTGDPAYRAGHMKQIFELLTKTQYKPILNLLNTMGEKLGLEMLKDIAGHGFAGRLAVSTADPRLALQVDKQLTEMAVLSLEWASTHLGTLEERAKRLAAGFDPNSDLTQGTQGAVLMPTTIDKKTGKRSSANDILQPTKDKYPDTIRTEYGVRVANVILDDQNRTTGVRYFDEEGKVHILHSNLVCVATGSLEAAPLLNRSGIGTEEQLALMAENGIAPKVVNNAVGKNQGDRREVGMVYELKKPLEIIKQLQEVFPTATVMDADQTEKLMTTINKDHPLYKAWLEHKTNSLGNNGPFVSMQMKSRPELKENDLFVFGVPGDFEGYWNGLNNSVKLAPGETKMGYAEHALHDPKKITFLVLDANKDNGHGTIECNPKDIYGAPIIDHHFELDGGNPALIFGMQQVRVLAERLERFGFIDHEVWPGADAKTPEQLQIKANAQKWGHHIWGGAAMGHPNDPTTVVDSNGKVLGTTGLLVIDASTLKSGKGTFLVSSMYEQGMLFGEKVVDQLKNGIKPAAKFNPLSIRFAKPTNTIEQARDATNQAAKDAKDAGMITAKQFAKMTNGTVSEVDLENAWKAIENVLAEKNGEGIGGDRHTLAHNLVLAVHRQIEVQGEKVTARETRGDRFWLVNALGLGG